MHYIPLGDTALRVSRLCLGCMTFGEPDRGRHAWTLPEESSRPLIQHAIEGGINFFDTANSLFLNSQRHPVSQTPAGLWMSRYSTPFLAYTIHLHINRILWKGRWQRWNRKRGRRKEKTCT